MAAMLARAVLESSRLHDRHDVKDERGVTRPEGRPLEQDRDPEVTRESRHGQEPEGHEGPANS
jgi:hypothetical protein